MNTCKKCGSDKILVRFHWRRLDCVAGKFNAWADLEHLHYQCSVCGFEWTGEPLEKEKSTEKSE